MGSLKRVHLKALGWSMLMVGVFLFGLAAGGRGQASDVLPGSAGDPLITRSYLEQYVGIQVVEMSAGQRLTAEAGAEIILRAGRATAVDGPRGGLADVTAGRDLRSGQEISQNHLLIVPRSDGRGVRAVTDVVLMVRGVFTLE